MGKYFIKPMTPWDAYRKEGENRIKSDLAEFKNLLQSLLFAKSLQVNEPDRKDLQDLSESFEDQIIRKYEQLLGLSMRDDSDDFDCWMAQGCYNKYLKQHETYCKEERKRMEEKYGIKF